MKISKKINDDCFQIKEFEEAEDENGQVVNIVRRKGIVYLSSLIKEKEDLEERLIKVNNRINRLQNYAEN